MAKPVNEEALFTDRSVAFIRQRMVECQITRQRTFVERTGLSSAYISAVLNQHTAPSAQALDIFARVLDTTTERIRLPDDHFDLPVYEWEEYEAAIGKPKLVAVSPPFLYGQRSFGLAVDSNPLAARWFTDADVVEINPDLKWGLGSRVLVLLEGVGLRAYEVAYEGDALIFRSELPVEDPLQAMPGAAQILGPVVGFFRWDSTSVRHRAGKHLHAVTPEMVSPTDWQSQARAVLEFRRSRPIDVSAGQVPQTMHEQWKALQDQLLARLEAHWRELVGELDFQLAFWDRGPDDPARRALLEGLHGAREEHVKSIRAALGQAEAATLEQRPDLRMLMKDFERELVKSMEQVAKQTFEEFHRLGEALKERGIAPVELSDAKTKLLKEALSRSGFGE